MVASREVADANAELEAATAATAKVQTEVAARAEVPKVYAEVAAAQTQLTQAMGDEVRWSNLLTDVSLTVGPDGTSGIFSAASTDGTSVDGAFRCT